MMAGKVDLVGYADGAKRALQRAKDAAEAALARYLADGNRPNRIAYDEAAERHQLAASRADAAAKLAEGARE